MASKKGTKKVARKPAAKPTEAVVTFTKADSASPLLDEHEAARYLRISRTTLIRRRQDGLIRYKRIGNRVFFTKENLDAYIADSDTDATSEATASAR